VIGVGWAGHQHADAYAELPGVELAGIAGLEEPVRRALADKHGVTRHVARWEELLEDSTLDVVSVAVPTFLHAPITLAALDKGLHVLCEKPIARTVEEAEHMVKRARENARVLDVAFNHRRRGDIETLKRVVDAGRLGRIYYAKAWWLRRTGIPTLGSWFTSSEQAGGGPLLDIGVHVLDYALYLLGQPQVTTVSASTYDLLGTNGFGSSPTSEKTGESGGFDVEDLATAFLRLDDGATLLLEASWATHRTDGDEFGVTLFGTEGGADLRVVDMEAIGTLKVFTDEHGVAAETRFSPPAGRGHVAVVERFLERVRDGGAADGETAATLARIVDACYRSAQEGREVTFA
jgi:predicted dehydrogenase